MVIVKKTSCGIIGDVMRAVLEVKIYSLLFVVLILLSGVSLPQAISEVDTLSNKSNLQRCVEYALSHYPALRQSLLDEEIAGRTVKSKLADWFPQLNFNFNVQHNFQLPVSVFGGNAVQIGSRNTSIAQFSLTQTIFNRDVLLASSTAEDVIRQSEQKTVNNKINVVVNVSKAFYAALLTSQQIRLFSDAIARLSRSLQDAMSQYKAGVVDKTDYERATIALNNARAQKKQADEALKTSFAFLKQQMGYPSRAVLTLDYDTTKMESEAIIDTNQVLEYQNRIEYQLLQSQRSILQANVSYNEWSFLPSLNAFGSYNLDYLNNSLSQLYKRMHPNSFAGLQLSFPIFQGGKRYQQIKIAQLELTRSDYDILLFKDAANTEYTQALASYKSNLTNYYLLKTNLNLATDVYNVIELQYRAGVRTYLDVITAETDLRTTQINYINALFQVLSSKLDVQRALGIIHY